MNEFVGLTAIGFTEYEAKVYLALLGSHPASGYQLSKLAGVPRSMVYEALGRLNARGAVLKTRDQRATLYRPVPPERLLERFDHEHQELMQNLRGRLLARYQTKPEEHLWTIQGRDAVLSYATQMVTSARVEIALVLADAHLNVLREALTKADADGVKINALLTGNEQLDYGRTAFHPSAESELQEMTGMLVVVADRKECLVADEAVEMKATITTNPNFVLIAHQFIWMELFTQQGYIR